MTTSTNDPDQNDRLERFPALASLRLDPGHWEALAQQGFVAGEQRGQRTYFKLRFRSEGRQVVRYLGDADRAEAVKAELKRLQQKTKTLRVLKARTKFANQKLREAKLALEPVLEARGFQFHGYAIRRPRTRRRMASLPVDSQFYEEEIL